MAPPAVTPLPALSRMRGLPVCDAEGRRIGTVRDALLAEDLTTIRYLAISAGRVSRLSHVVPIREVGFVNDGTEEYASVPFSAEHLRGAPTIEQDQGITAEGERAIAAYFVRADDWEATRASVRARQTTPAPTPQIAQATIADAIEQGESPPRRGRPPAGGLR